MHIIPLIWVNSLSLYLQYVTEAVLRGSKSSSTFQPSEADKRAIPHLANNLNSTPVQPELNHNDRVQICRALFRLGAAEGVTGGEGRKPLENGAFAGCDLQTVCWLRQARGDSPVSDLKKAENTAVDL